MEVAGPLGTPLGLAQERKASACGRSVGWDLGAWSPCDLGQMSPSQAADFLGFQVKLSLRYPSAATLCFFPFPSNWKALGSFLSWSFAHELSSLSGSLLPHLCSAMHPLLCSRSHVQLQGLSCSNWSNLDVKLEEGGLTESPEDTLFPGSSWQELPAYSWHV